MLRRMTQASMLLAGVLALGPAAAQGQVEGRMRVMIPNFLPAEGAKKDFGEKTAEELRKLINTLATHQPVAKKEIEDNVKKFDLKMEELDCIRARQLASQINAGVALCASFKPAGAGQFTVEARFVSIANGEEFVVQPVTGTEKQETAAAQEIFTQFDGYVQQIRSTQFCGDYAQSQQWDEALNACDRAIQLNPAAVSTRFLRAQILYDAERHPASLEELRKVLDLNPMHEEALQLAGYLAATQGQDEDARDFYTRYLELNPSSSQIRMKIAYDLAQAGDPLGGMQFIQVGLDVEPDNVDLLEQFAGMAFNAALEATQNAQMASGAQDAAEAAVPAEAVELYRKAVDAYQKVYAAKGAETPVAHLRQIMAAFIQIQDYPAAIRFGESVLQTHAREDVLWSIYADALQRNGELDKAITALDRVREINPSHPTASLRQGNWLIEAGRVQDAIQVFKGVAQANPQQADQATRLVFANAYQNGVQKQDWNYAVSVLSTAREIPNVSPALMNQLNFWAGYSLYQGSVKDQEAQTLQSAQATLPKFQQARQLLQQSGDYPASVNVNLTQLLDNTNTYIEIQDAIIKRGR